MTRKELQQRLAKLSLKIATALDVLATRIENIERETNRTTAEIKRYTNIITQEIQAEIEELKNAIATLD